MSHKDLNRSIRLLLWGAPGVVFASSVLAQAVDPPETGAQVEEVIVTATKRASTVQDTPISLTALSGEELQDRGLTDFTALSQSVPGISMRTSGPGQTEFEMRGMTSSGGNSPTVGFYLDDTPLTAPAAAQNGKVVIDPNLYDLNRVEVLRGPQGTLYGSGSMGGTVKVVTNPPNPGGLDASAQSSLSDTRGGGFNYAGNAMLNIPLVADTLAIRIVGTASHDSGWIDRLVVGPGKFPLETNNFKTRGNVLAAPVAADYKDVNYENLGGARINALWKVTDKLSVTAGVFFQQIHQGAPNAIDSDPGTNAHYEVYNAPEPFNDRFELYSLNVQYKFDAFDLTSTTSKWNRNETLFQDATESQQWGFGLPSFAAPAGFGPVNSTQESDLSRQFSEEVRLTSSNASRFSWLIGYFYSRFQSDWDYYVVAPDLPRYVGVAGLGLTSNLFDNVQPTKIKQSAVFADLTYELTQGLKLNAGVRRYSYSTSVVTDVSGYAGPTGNDSDFHSVAGAAAQGLNPKVNLSYEPNKNLLVYATAAKGFRPGGGNQPIPVGPTGLGPACLAALEAFGRTSAPTSFGPDTVWSYEIGNKVRAFDNRLTVNSAIYFEKWNGVQQNIPLSCGFPYTDNAGDAQIYGGELEINGVIAPGLTVSANAGYTHATFSVGSQEAGVAVGDRVQDVPDWTSTVALSYRHRGPGDTSFMARIENSYVGSRIDATYGINLLPSYDLTNARFGLLSDRWSAVLFAKNIFNKRALLTDITSLSINTPTYNRVAVSQPLTVGLELNYHFGQ